MNGDERKRLLLALSFISFAVGAVQLYYALKDNEGGK
jgi:hypothetical protein